MFKFSKIQDGRRPRPAVGLFKKKKNVQIYKNPRWPPAAAGRRPIKKKKKKKKKKSAPAIEPLLACWTTVAGDRQSPDMYTMLSVHVLRSTFGKKNGGVM
jgi:hypothetical protein